MITRIARRVAMRLTGTCLLLGSHLVLAQAPAPYPLPDLDLRTNGRVHAMLLQPDLSLVIAGSFTRVNGVERNNIARMQPNGQLDTSWSPNLPGEGIYALARDSQGRIYAGGEFTVTAGSSRVNLVRVAGNGVVDAGWAPQPDGPVYALAVEPGGNPRVYAGGGFQEIGGVSARYLVRLDGTSAQTDIFWPAAGTDGEVRALLFDQDGTSIFVGGRFLTMAAQPRRYLARVDLATGITRGWNANIDISGIHPGAAPGVYALARAGNGSLLVGGVYRQIGGLGRTSLARVGQGATAVVDASWAPQLQGPPDAEPEVRAIGVDDQGGVLVGGRFVSIGGLSRSNLARISPASTGAVDTQWDAALDDGPVHALVPAAGTTIVFAGGEFEYAHGQIRMGHAAFGHAGQPLDRVAHVAGQVGRVYALARHQDGGVVAGGEFNIVNGQIGRRNILKLLPNGNLDLSWSPRFDGSVLALAAAANGAVFAGGAFSMADGLARMRLARITPGGDIDPVWNQGAWGGSGSPSQINALAMAPNGSVYVGGHFTAIGPSFVGNVPRSSLARLPGTGNGTPDPWAPAVINGTADAGTVRSIAVSPDGQSVFVGGRFTRVGGQNRSHVAKISSAGTVDGQWQAAASDQVRALQVTSDGQVYAGGFFQQIGGQARAHLARLSAGTGAVDAWNPGPDDPVLGLAIAGDGAVIAAGLFTAVGGEPRAGLARILAVGGGPLDGAWNPGVLGIPQALLAGGDELHVGGYYFEVGGEPRLGLARLPASGSDLIFRDGFDDAP